MTEMSFESFTLPSALPAPSLGGFPSWAQLKGRLVHILPTGRQDNVTSPKQATPHTRLTCEVTFLSGDPITAVIDQFGGSTPLNPPIGPGQVMVDMFVSQTWFVRRLKDKVGVPGFPGIVGIVSQELVKGNQMWTLTDPSQEQMRQVAQWFGWRQQQGPAAHYVAIPVQQAPPVAPPVQYAQQAPAAAPAGSPFAQTAPAAAPAAPAQPAGPWQPTLPPGMTPAAPAAAPVAPAAQPGPDVPPWQR